MDHQSLLYVVHQRCHKPVLRTAMSSQAFVPGGSVTLSGRAGPVQEIAAHAGFHSLDSVALHERRENLLRHNVASRLGL